MEGSLHFSTRVESVRSQALQGSYAHNLVSARLSQYIRDVHPGNVMCNKKGNICLIDLGWAVHKDDQPYKGHPTGERSFKVLKEIQDENVEDFW